VSVQLSPERQEAELDGVSCICRTHRHDWECETYPFECQAYCDGGKFDAVWADPDKDQVCVVCYDMWANDPRQP
jgi:hypothetical protein